MAEAASLCEQAAAQSGCRAGAGCVAFASRRAGTVAESDAKSAAAYELGDLGSLLAAMCDRRAILRVSLFTTQLANVRPAKVSISCRREVASACCIGCGATRKCRAESVAYSSVAL
eukprot:CAMPEP_0179919970 /NCGR_PEP_ID=MMETSP0983-20121128/4206_1 /TAXON_ID=483367 /ORGANISM="non described non described, Strain CCMP 2436" /LENGTH=115 /DNA_ID=CAMNT_0021822919 /DNA_START=130 /DNA_END=478 /DNA_ORIENTATION=-